MLHGEKEKKKTHEVTVMFKYTFYGKLYILSVLGGSLFRHTSTDTCMLHHKHLMEACQRSRGTLLIELQYIIKPVIMHV